MPKVDAPPAPPPKPRYLDVLFDAPPGPDDRSGRFVEVNDEAGNWVKARDWFERPDGLWAIRIPVVPAGSIAERGEAPTRYAADQQASGGGFGRIDGE